MSSLLRSSTALGWAAAFLGPALISSLDVLSNRPSAQLAGFLYLLAVSLAAYLGGFTAGLVATVLSTLCLDFFFTPPRHDFVPESGDQAAGVALFFVVAILISQLFERRRQVQQQLQRRFVGPVQVVEQEHAGRLLHAALDVFEERAEHQPPPLVRGHVRQRRDVGVGAAQARDHGRDFRREIAYRGADRLGHEPQLRGQGSDRLRDPPPDRAGPPQRRVKPGFTVCDIDHTLV